MPLPPPPKKRATMLAIDDTLTDRPAAKKTAPSPAVKPSAMAAPKAQSDKRQASKASSAAATVAAAVADTAVAQQPLATTAASTKKRKPPIKVAPATRKLFVLDTNVLMHDPTCLFRFEEHDIYLALIVLEEMDSHKKGSNEVARNVRQASRMLDALVASAPKKELTEGIALDATGYREATGDLFFQTRVQNYTLPTNALPQGKADNQILGVVAALEKQHPQRQVVLV